jgi:hypothetical protein
MNLRDIQTLSIEEGPLGPVAPCTLEVAPFTVLIGKQGTGKSLIAQVLYLFNHLPYLVPYYKTLLAKAKKANSPPIAPVKIILDAFRNLRSSGRPFASSFVDSAVMLTWSPKKHASPEVAFSVEIHRLQSSESYALNQELQSYVTAIEDSEERALFIPTERLLYSQGNGPSIWQLLSLPVTLQFFADAMERAARTVDAWDGGKPDTAEGRWVAEEAARALAGSIRRQGDAWRWTVPSSTRPVSLPIDMASSGQRANWPLALLAQVLFSWRQSGTIAEPYSIYVEEPEIHLHPEAQVAMVRILAFLVNHGFRVVVTTHSLTILYALNNLVLASALDGGATADVPEPAVRLRPEQVAAYALHLDGRTQDIVDHTTGFLSEVELGEVTAALGDQMNHIALLRDRLAVR